MKPLSSAGGQSIEPGPSRLSPASRRLGPGPRLGSRDADGGGGGMHHACVARRSVPVGRVRFSAHQSRRAGGRRHCRGPLRCTRHGKHAPCACMRPLRAPCVPALCAHFGPSLRVPALRTSACPYCVHGVLVQFVVDMCVLDHTPAARAQAVCARAVRLRAARVVRLCSVRLDRAAFARQRRRHRG